MTDEHRPHSRTLIEHLLLALRLDIEFYTRVSTDRRTTFQAFMVVVLGGFCNGLGLAHRLGSFGVWAGMVAAIGGWLLWTLVLLLIARLFRCRRNGRSLLRALGFASAPQVLLILAGSPLVAVAVRVLVVCWLLASATVALQAVYTIGRRRAVVVTLVGFVVYMLIGVGSGYWATTSDDGRLLPGGASDGRSVEEPSDSERAKESPSMPAAVREPPPATRSGADPPNLRRPQDSAVSAQG